MKTSTVSPSFYYVFNILLYCNDSMPSFYSGITLMLVLKLFWCNRKVPIIYHQAQRPYVENVSPRY